MPEFKDRTGGKYTNKNGYTVEIIKYVNWHNCTIKFEDGTIVEGISFGNISGGTFGNKNHRSFSGVGYFGYGKFKGDNPLTSFYLNTWSCMLKRCYRDDVHKRQPHYKGCTVAEEWHNFQNFAQWMEDNYNPVTMKSWQLDKDTINKGNTIYSKESCIFIPSEINLIFTKRPVKISKLPPGVKLTKGGRFTANVMLNKVKHWLGVFDTPELAFEAYKTAKETHIKNLADKWKNLIDPRVYQALYNYKVEITD